ncbi:MAG: hypothetical protein JNG89_05610 [Planctomycetaceae bacterium]|nr:hypothetical protein [Planctomycetaceae bacterium]
MDCRIARELLEVARSHPRDREGSDLHAAFAHLDECPACADAYDFQRSFDRRFGEVVRQVAVPSDLQSRLRESLAATATLPQPATAPAEHVRPMRRALLVSAAAAALLIATGLTWYVGHREPAPLAAATVLDWWKSRLAEPNGADVRSLPTVDEGFDLTAVDPRWLRLSQADPRGADLDNDGRQDAAVVPIAGGFVVVLPANRVTDPPAARAAGNATPAYLPALHVAWTHNHSMHLCFLPGRSPRELQQLISKVYDGAA